MALDHDRYNHIARMRRSASVLRRSAWRLATLGTAGMILASCGTAASSLPLVKGVPSIGISVPLQQVACTLGNSCVAVGTSNASLGPSVVGEYREASGRWVSLTVPGATSAQMNAASCWSSDCLLGGAQSTGDLLWDYRAADHTVSVAVTPTGGVGISALDCYGPLTCALIDTSANGQYRFSETIDGGTTWTSSLPLDWTSGDSVTSLACNASANCLVGATTPSGQVQLAVTHDAGATWVARSTSSAWTGIASLTCRARACVALAATSRGSRIIRSTNLGLNWNGVQVSANASALACTTWSRCVAVGQSAAGTPWLARVTRVAVTIRSLQYVPSPLLDVACGTKVCAAIGVTTLLALQP
jgi:hypothetical protein